MVITIDDVLVRTQYVFFLLFASEKRSITYLPSRIRSIMSRNALENEAFYAVPIWSLCWICIVPEYDLAVIRYSLLTSAH